MTPDEDDGTRVLALIEEHHDSLRALLTEEQYELLLVRLRALAETPAEISVEVRRAFQLVRRCLVDLPYDHPVRQAVDSVRLVATATDVQPMVLRTADLLARLAAGPPLSAREPEPGAVPGAAAGLPAPREQEPSAPPVCLLTTEQIIAAAERRLLGAPTLSAGEVRTRYGGSAPPPELIRLADPDRGDRYPEFQFRPGDGAPYDVVLEVNRVLLAHEDPWGAADWWLSGNTWLGGGPPAGLLGVRPDRDLVGAAIALVEGE
ncbi:MULTISPECIES: hypothetical protein [unclassified Streptomyces]|uniref:hypothetical protein n=1 Tax=unclassified Streptomyces TaxID=2593676 RepID=UPI000DAD4CDA|nr:MULTISPECIES: hypothetical protein [unclassified Streptomyces]PZT73680.1 hypothetical protein DNK55_15655 [Streptomyces sp. AC1-42T]PZT83327.1 hypothetical protein DNK56_15770 [Streptomyces sp. AC1-42W]